MMTEDEAKTKWCPFVRLSVTRWFGDPPIVPITATANRVIAEENQEKTFCISSACMAWRWIDTGVSVEGSTNNKYHKRVTGHTETHGRALLADIRGYCGLAGRP